MKTPGLRPALQCVGMRFTELDRKRIQRHRRVLARRHGPISATHAVRDLLRLGAIAAGEEEDDG